MGLSLDVVISHMEIVKFWQMGQKPCSLLQVILYIYKSIPGDDIGQWSLWHQGLMWDPQKTPFCLPRTGVSCGSLPLVLKRISNIRLVESGTNTCLSR